MAMIAKAQKGEIIYTDFEPDLVKTFYYYNVSQHVFHTDLDNDGIVDFYFYSLMETGAPTSDIFMRFSHTEPDGWQRKATGLCHYGDTLSTHNVANSIGASFCYYHPNPEGTKYLGFRFIKDDENYYGWVELYLDYDTLRLINPTLTMKRMAYCTIPNYPLIVGQTDFTWDVEGNGVKAFADVYPNPTIGVVTVTGTNLKQAEILNTLGQRVAMVQGQGETLRIDIANLPAGVYFVNVMDEGGRKCVRKVLKE